MNQVLRRWVDGERLWLRHVGEDASGGWGGVLEMLSLVTLVAISAIGWLAVVVVLIESV
jgi:hypothetical protein